MIIDWWLLPLPYLVAILNRLWRGEGEVPRYVWYAFMTVLAAITCHPALLWTWKLTPWLFLYPMWALFLAGYALLPWQAMFAAVKGIPPTRQDPAYIQWLQDFAYMLNGMTPGCFYTPSTWKRFGITYGTLRAMFMLPGIVMMWGYTGSLVALSGGALLGMGLVYYAGGRLAQHLGNVDSGVALAEIMMGALIGDYILIIAGLLQ